MAREPLPSSRALAIASAALTVAAFLLPWAHLEVNKPGLLKKVTSGMERSMGRSLKTQGRAKTQAPKAKGLATVPTRVRGYEVPILANRQQAKVATRLVEMFTKEKQDIGPRSWAVYAVPGLAVACAALLCLPLPWPVGLAVGVLALAVGGGGTWQLLAMRSDELLQIRFGTGLWLSLAGYYGLAAAAGLAHLPIRRKI